MVMCSNCHKRVAVIFVTKVENGEKSSQGLCIKCAKDLGLPIDSMMGDIYNKMGISPDQMENMEDGLAEMISSEGEDGGAPAIDLPKLFGEGGLADMLSNNAQSGEGGNIVPINPSKNKKDAPKNDKKQGKTSCGCGCSACAMKDMCHSQNPQNGQKTK